LLLEQAEKSAANIEDDAEKAWALMNIASAWANLGRFRHAADIFERAATSAEAIPDAEKDRRGTTLMLIARAQAEVGEWHGAAKTADVKAVPIKADATTEAIPATPEFAYTGKYPLARFLYVYVNHKPGTELDPLRREFIRFMFSKQGQESVVKDGYYPVNAKIAGEELARLGIQVSSR
ncbi:MAG: hypothetical protein L0Z51_09210, partial [Candidatus Latescibacteria bacterium]|nr:hypothetical protein [Candidatus Latescibacterota bacterium]